MFTHNNETFVQQRTTKDIWQNLYEFHLEETAVNPEWDQQKVDDWLMKKKLQSKHNTVIISAQKQILTHQVIRGCFICVELSKKPTENLLNGVWLNNDDLKNKAFPQFLHQFIHKKSLQLQVL